MDFRCKAGCAVEHRFIVDINVGRLAKWLRAMGYDALLEREADDAELVVEVQRQGRILLTKDSFLTQRKAITSGQVRAVLIQFDDIWSQLRQVVDALDLDFSRGFSLCIECNAPLEPRHKSELQHRVPPYVYSTQQEFMECPMCDKIYWRGTHWHNMLKELAKVKEVALGR